ncbi:DNA primase [Psychromonas ingrahamii 37]|uniref:DNA primase n=1 Tax=Psychromonas ingrahamii (strain DSM 17664 / CCUG 51855 / 37) TaxID=357804 RepID=A1SRR2_PSYIN|nr:DNA primase [Psychromonas ingrahamii]ABM02177.1 DNA primase [Psychromonas ingrahamii 37]
MAGRIPRNFIDDLIARTDIVDFIDSRVKLKKQGKDYRACCPFHNGNNNSSFSVSSDKQFYHCFNCGVSGNVLSFIMEYDGIEFVDAIETLAEQLSIEVPREESGFGKAHQSSYVDRKDLYQLMADIAVFYQQQLRTHKNSQQVINYLKGRGLSGQTVKHFKIGYAPDGWNEVRKRFAVSADLEKQLIEAGMLISKEKSGSYDRFRDRLMFPIHDRRGRVIGFGGRVLGDNEPKYLNSPETPLFHKGKELYGLYQVKQAYKEIKRVLVVEGYMDVVALGQFGIDYAVASLGTSTTPEHIQQLFRHTSEVICCFDGDKAGKAAAWRALENALPYIQDGRTLRFMFLADGEDPDSYVQKEGKEAFEKLIEQALPLSDFLFQHLLNQVDMSTADSKAKLAQLAIPLMSKLPDTVFRQMMEGRLIALLGIEKEGLNKLLPAAASNSRIDKRQKVTPMRLAISVLLQHPNIAYGLPEFPEFKEMTLPGLSLLNSLLEICRTTPTITTGQLLEHWREKPESSQLNKLAVWQNDIKEDYYEAFFLDTLENFLNFHLTSKIEFLKQKSRLGQALTSAETQQLALLLAEQKQH